MRVVSLVSAGAAVALALGAAATAQAKIITVTYTGTVISGADQTGVFGAPNVSLANDIFTAVFTIDTSINANFSKDAVAENFYGGAEYLPAHNGLPAKGTTSPVSATLTINGHTIAVPGVYWGRVWDSTTPGGASELNLEVQDKGVNGDITYSDDLENRIFSYVNVIDPTTDFTQPLNYTVKSGDTINESAFTDSVCNTVTGACSVKVTAALKPTSVTIVPQGVVAGLPEPATWAMMILGVAMIGFAARRRNEGAAVAA